MPVSPGSAPPPPLARPAGPGARGEVVAASGLTFSYGDTPVLGGATFSVERGELVALAGSNGSGKSTLIRVLLGLLRPSGGTASVLGEPPGQLSEPWRLGYVAQRPMAPSLLPATVLDVVMTGRLACRGWWRRMRPADWEAVDVALDAVALGGMRDRSLGELSGGQQQRAFIAKALVSEPDLLVLDEPTAGVDAESQARFRDAIVHLTDVRGGTVLLVSHELGAVAEDLDRILLLRRGRIAFDGPPAELAAAGVSLGVHDTDLPIWLEGLD